MPPVLTSGQKTTLTNDIAVTNASEVEPGTGQTFSQLVAAKNYQPLADAYNLPANPTYWVWKTALTAKEIYETTTPAPDNTTWDWTQYIAQSQGEQGAWSAMFSPGTISPARPNVQGAFAKIFAGAGAGPTAQRAHLNAMSRRPARRTEKLLVVSGSGTTGTPGTMGFEGMLRAIDLANAFDGVVIP